MVNQLSYVEKVYDWWGAHSTAYGLLTGLVCLGRECTFRKEVLRRLRPKYGDIVLDLVCGTGRNFPYLYEYIGEPGTIVGFDYSSGMLKRASKIIGNNHYRNVKLIQGDAAYIDFPSDVFDGAVCTFGLSAMPDHFSAILNIYHVLKPGKRFVVLDAKLFNGKCKALNPIIKPMFKYTTNWDYRKDIPGAIRKIFDEVSISQFNGGSIFIVTATKNNHK